MPWGRERASPAPLCVSSFSAGPPSPRMQTSHLDTESIQPLTRMTYSVSVCWAHTFFKTFAYFSGARSTLFIGLWCKEERTSARKSNLFGRASNWVQGSAPGACGPEREQMVTPARGRRAHPVTGLMPLPVRLAVGDRFVRGLAQKSWGFTDRSNCLPRKYQLLPSCIFCVADIKQSKATQVLPLVTNSPFSCHPVMYRTCRVPPA